MISKDHQHSDAKNILSRQASQGKIGVDLVKQDWVEMMGLKQEDALTLTQSL